MTSLVEKILSNFPAYALINAGLIILLGLATIIIQIRDLAKVDWNTKAYLGKCLIISIVMLLLLCSLYVFSALSPLTEVNSYSNPWFDISFSLILYFPIFYSYYYLSINERKEGRRANPLSFPLTMLWVLGGVCATWAINMFVELSGLANWITIITQSPPVQEIITELLSSKGQDIIAYIILAVIIAPIVEEFFFRGLIATSLKRVIGRWPGIILSSLLFGVIHCALPQVFALSFIGIVLCLAHERAKSIWLPILIHASFNGINIILMFMIAQ